jgi:hypothetical protein
MEQFCIHCGTRLYDEGAFCHGCGQPKAGAASSAGSATTPGDESYQKPIQENRTVLPPETQQISPQQQTPVNVTLKTPFGQVFSVTGKVLLALFLIGLGIGVIYLIISAVGSASHSSGSSDYTNTYINNREFYDKDADEAPTKVPSSRWKSGIAADIKGHCIREGMTYAEVEQAVGKPTSKKAIPPDGANSDKGEAWEYVKQEQVSKPCSKYEGDQCADPVEYQTKKATLYFSPNGHLTYPYLSGGLKMDVGEYFSCY